LTIKLTRHVAAATCFSRKCRADNSPFSFHNSLSRAELADLNAWRLLQCKRSKTLRVLASFFSCQRASALGTPERSAPGGTSENSSNRNKKPGVERRANPSAAGERFRAMLD